jgi:flagellum-specific ATP synthase
MIDYLQKLSSPSVIATKLQSRTERYSENSIVPIVEGRLVRMTGLAMEAVGLNVAIGTRCRVKMNETENIEAEVVGFADERIYLMAVEKVQGIRPGAIVTPLSSNDDVPAGYGLLGRVVDGAGRVLDGMGELQNCPERLALSGPVINPLQRKPVHEPLDVGVRSINASMTVGKGQRLGLFAGSGVGKSVLLGMMTKYTSADVVVVGLIGERGREVKEFIEQVLGKEGLRRAVVVASPADDAPLMRLRASRLATRYAEYFRDQGKSVLLLMDSLTRYAQAQREIALAIGEPPATKGYPPSVFSQIPNLVERAGNDATGKGAITAIYTVLTEGDDLQDPVADSARAILDGHIVLSRQLADEGHYPAIDIEASISRVMPNVISKEHLQAAQLVKRMYSRYQQNRDLIAVGAYAPGSDPETDRAVQVNPVIRAFLQQALDEKYDFLTSQKQLMVLAKATQGETAGIENRTMQAINRS